MRRLRGIFVLSVCISILGLFATELTAACSPQTQIRISGTVNGPQGPVANVWIGIGSALDWQIMYTDGNGSYSVTLKVNGQVWFHVRPDISTRLTHVNLWKDGVTGDFTQDFKVSNGYLLSLRVIGKEGTISAGDIWFEVQGFAAGPWYMMVWEESLQRYQTVLPPGAYRITARHLPDGYYETAQSFDLRNGDLIADMPLNSSFVPPMPYEPPVASRISIGSPDQLGEANITGSAGSVLPLSHVLLVNLSSNHQAQAISESDGSFQARIFAPPGSALMIKHGPAGWRWNDLKVGLSEGVNPFPGTIIHIPHEQSGDQYNTAFAAVGAIETVADDVNTTRNYVSSAWALTGTSGPVRVDAEWKRILDGVYNGRIMPGLYIGGLNMTHPTLADLDADGDLDLLVGDDQGRLVFFRNKGTSKLPNWEFEQLNFAGVSTGNSAAPALADVTADGAPDLFVGTQSGSILLYYNRGTRTVPEWPKTPDQILQAGNGAAPALVDLDGDGDLDLVVGQNTGTLCFFRNKGTPSNSSWQLVTNTYGGISEPNQGSPKPTFIDLDNDGNLDLLLGLSGKLVWYRNSGTRTNPTWTRMADNYMGFSGSCCVSVAAGDWDGDGDWDLITGEHWGVLRFFRNDRPPAWAEQYFDFPFDWLGDSAPALGDYNNDGRLDLLVGQAHGGVHKYTNIGTATEPNWRPDGTLLSLPWTNHPHAFPALADIDGDGDLDLFVGEGGWQGKGAGGNIWFYRNEGTPYAPKWTLVTDKFLGIDIGGWSTPTFADVDADGDLDLFIGDEDGTITFVENIGTVKSPAWAAPVPNYGNLKAEAYSAPCFLDVDGDGDLDLLIGSKNGSLAYVRNNGTIKKPVWQIVSTEYPGIDVGQNSTPFAADINGDKKAELLIGSGGGGLSVYLNKGATPPPISKGSYSPGDLLLVDGTVKIFSQAINQNTNVSSISVTGWLGLLMLFGANGQPHAAENYFMSTRLTPTGFPVQNSIQAIVPLGPNVAVTEIKHAGEYALQGILRFSIKIPTDLPNGIYRPIIGFNFAGVPGAKDWLAANVTRYTYFNNQAALPPISIGSIKPPRLIWRLLMDDFSRGTRGSGAREDKGVFELASDVVTQGAPHAVPSRDARTGQLLTYRLEPFLPMISFTDRRMPTPPLIPFALPGGSLRVTIQKPDGSIVDLGEEAFAQSFNRTRTTRLGNDLNSGTVQLEDVYSLKAATDRFRFSFDQSGHHVIRMEGSVKDLWGNTYSGGGSYDLWAAEPLNIEPGVLPGTPFAVGDAFNFTGQLHPGVPADVTITITHYPNSDPGRAWSSTLSGRANQFGYFSLGRTPVRFDAPGEYRVDLFASYSNKGTMLMGAMAWGGVVMTPKNQAQLIAHGRRGVDSLQYIPNHWFVANRDLNIPKGAVSHVLNPYFNGDILWSRKSDQPGDALVMGSSVQDTIGDIESDLRARAAHAWVPTSAPGSLSERFDKGEIPLFSTTQSRFPLEVEPDQADLIAYSYRCSQRPGVRVREVVTEDGHNGGYWRLNTLYDDQAGVGVAGDLPNDYKFQYVGVVYRNLATKHSEYLGQGTGWVFIPDDDPTGTRVMPPFSGQGNGGWTTEGGPILKLKGKSIDIFILPTGTGPGAILRVGNSFRFAGHIMPTLNSQVEAIVTAPSGIQYGIRGKANDIGYFYDSSSDFEVYEPGVWSVTVRVWHDGQCSGGKTVAPYPSGDVLGSDIGRYWFYVVGSEPSPLEVSSPQPGFLKFRDSVTPIPISGPIPAGLTNVTIDYTIRMPGYILEHGKVSPGSDKYQIVFDPAKLSKDFPNLDLTGRDECCPPGLSDTLIISLMLQGRDQNGNLVHKAGQVTLQGEQVLIAANPATDAPPALASLVSPSGTIKTTTPAYVWNAVQNASHYQLWVNDSGTVGKIQRWFSAAEAGCPSGKGTCLVTPSLALTLGAAKWWVRAWNLVGYGPWSVPLSFIVSSAGDGPGKATLISPSGQISAVTPTYIWNAVPAATWYQLWVNDSTTSSGKITKWYRATDAGCSSGAGNCSATPSTVLARGAAQWWIQTWNDAGYGPWSDGMTFTVGGAGPPGKATLISPTGIIATPTPTYTWNGVMGSTWYLLWVNDSTGSAKIKTWYTAEQAGCGAGTGTCAVKPSTALVNGAAQWWIQTWNDAGYGPWSDGIKFTIAESLLRSGLWPLFQSHWTDIAAPEQAKSRPLWARNR